LASPAGNGAGRRLAAAAARAAAAAQVFVDDPERPRLSEEDAHHLGRVLRLRDGEEVVVSDGSGAWRRTTWQGGELVPLHGAGGPGGDGSLQFERRDEPALTVVFAPVKGERPEWVAQKLTELGMDRIVPLRAERSVVRWTGARGQAAVDKLRRVVHEAAAQCRRVWLPEVGDTLAFAQLRALGAPGEVVLAQLSGDRPTLAHRVVAVGPEGGWSDAELGSGLPTVGFGLSVLRAETAAVTAGALLASLRTGTVAAAGVGDAVGGAAPDGHGSEARPGKFVAVNTQQQRGGDPGA
jgi:16S rRNA (uracil1498-N3)-methyltransferase